MSLWSRLERRLSDLAGELLLDEYKDEVAHARELLAAGAATAAVEALEALLADKPDHGPALVLLAAAQLAATDPTAALATARRALAHRPGDPAALLAEGQALLTLLRADEAITPLARAVAEAGGDRALLAEIYGALGAAWRRRGELDKAVRELRKAVAEAPGEAEAEAALGEALLADGGHDPAEVRRHLTRGADHAPPPVLASLGLGRLELDDGAPRLAHARFTEALAQLGADDTPLGRALRIDALVGLGDVGLAERDPQAAHQRYLEALGLDPRRPGLHAKVGDAHRAIGNHAVAVEAYERALGLGAGPDVLRAALAAAGAAGDAARQIRWANDLLAVEPDSPAALVARGLGTLAAGDPATARALLAVAAAAGDADALAGLAAVDLAEDDLAAAAAHAQAALRAAPHHGGARTHLATIRRRQAALPQPGADDLPALGTALERVLGGHPTLSAHVGDVARAIAELDSPLLVTVMGEFSSGKSSFVNAFIGAEVAPTGILPTTSTINVVRFGAEPAGRVHHRDGAVRALAWDALFPYLRGLSDDDARTIDRVEILVPLPQLERIHLVDTPGLNSIQPEHEATARAFIARADAVVWVFTAGQGGKASERAALEGIRAEGRRVLGVLNKADQLGADELAEVLAFVRGTLGELVEVVVPVSARDALAWRRAEAAGADATSDRPDGNWGAVATALEERFFAQARQLKRDAAARRLRAVIAAARGALAEQHARAEAGADAARAASAALDRAGAEFVERVVAEERRSLATQTTELYRQAAREVLELVRPRRLPFGAHTATAADREYLAALLDHGFELVLDAGRRRVARALADTWRRADAAAREIAAVVAADVAGDVARVADDHTRLALALAFDRARAYLRGYLDGGTVDAFFREALPRLELAEDAVFHALFRAAPDLDRELGDALARAGEAAIAAVRARLAHWAGQADVASYDLEVGTVQLLDELAAQLA
ncbi:MAG: dynamin family protein [Kofleriaceae bacterium]